MLDSEPLKDFFRYCQAKLFSGTMIIGKTKKELDKMRAAGALVAEVRETLRGMVAPGVTTMELNNVAEKMIRDAGAYPTFLGYHGFPYSICASLNEQVVHGFPGDTPLQEGDIISLDMGATLDGFVGDTAFTAPVGEITAELKKLLEVTEESLNRAIQQTRAGKHLGDIGWAVQSIAEEHGYGIVRDYCGHGIGRSMHEAPQITNYGRPGTKEKIRVGYVFAIEPMINLGTHQTKVLSDKWTVVTLDGKQSAHFEHTIAVTEEGPEVLTLTKAQRAAQNGGPAAQAA
jgi:methionyl aminopeptidase